MGPTLCPQQLLVYRGSKFILDLASGYRKVAWNERFCPAFCKKQRPSVPWGYTGRQKGDGHMLAKKGIVSSGTGCEKRPTCGEVSKHQLPSDQGLGCFDFYLCYFHSHSYFTIQEQPLAGQLCSPGITQGFWASYRAEVQLRLCLLSPTPWELLTQTFFFF